MGNVERNRLAIWLIALVALHGCGRGTGARDARGAGVPAVEAVQARRGALPLEERLNGVVKAFDQVSIRAEISAPVVEVRVRSGDPVQKGQTLVRLQADALREQARQAEAAVRLERAAVQAAKARVADLAAQTSRARTLAEQELVSALERERLEAQLAAARAEAAQAEARHAQAGHTLQERRAAVDKTIIRAPVSGRVGRRNVEVGMLAEPGAVLFEVGNLDRLIVEVPLTGEMLGHVREGQRARITAPALGGEPLEAKLARIPPFLAPGSFSTVGEIDVRNPAGRLRPGMFVTVDILHGESEQATLVPLTALHDDPRTGARGVFVVSFAGAVPAATPPTLSAEPQAVTLRPVEVVAEGRAAAGVRGVEPGEWVVIVGQHLLAAGGDASARVRPTTWEHVLALQAVQREDLISRFLEEQRAYARQHGAEPPSNEDFLRGSRTGG